MFWCCSGETLLEAEFPRAGGAGGGTDLLSGTTHQFSFKRLAVRLRRSPAGGTAGISL